MLTFTKIESPPALRPLVQFFWSLAVARDGEETVHTVLPDGAADIVLNGSLPTADEPFASTGIYLSGMASRAYRESLFNLGWIVGARLRPGGVHALLGVPDPDLINCRVPLATLLTDRVRPIFEHLAHPSTPEEALRVLASFLTRAMAHARPIDPVLDRALGHIESARGDVRIADLDALGINERTLRRKFDRYVGVSPKGYARLLRFAHAVNLARASRDRDWAGLAAETGYFDQSHLIHEFAELTGVTPEQYFAATKPVRFFQYPGLGSL